MREVNIAKYTTENHIGATLDIPEHLTQRMETQQPVLKKQVSIEDLFTGDTFYAESIKNEWMQVKDKVKDQAFTLEAYQQVVLHTHAFTYHSIQDQQVNQEFWGNILALGVLVVATLVFPPAGITLGAIYASLELSSSVSGKDWISGRELDKGERVIRGALAPIDIIPGVKAVPTFQTFGRVNKLQKIAKSSNRTSTEIKETVSSVVQVAKIEGARRTRQAQQYALERVARTALSFEKPLMKLAEFGDQVITGKKEFIEITSRRQKVVVEGHGQVHIPPKNTHDLKNGWEHTLNECRKIVEGAGKANSKEIFLDTASSHNSARKMLIDELDSIGAFKNGLNSYQGRLKSSYGYEKQIGRQSLDGKVRWRLDFDEEIGVHYNIEDFSKGKGVNAVKKVIPINISEQEYKKIIDLWNR